MDMSKEDSKTRVIISNFYITDEAGAEGYMELDLKVVGKRDPMTYGKLHKVIEEAIRNFQ